MRPNADLYVFDEANSALDPDAQHELFERIIRGCIMTHDGQRRRKTVIWVTHRLSGVRRADKSKSCNPSIRPKLTVSSQVAMFKEGVRIVFFFFFHYRPSLTRLQTIVEFGTFQELLSLQGSFADFYGKSL